MTTKRIVLTTLVALIVLLAVLVYFVLDPSSPAMSKYFPKCPVYWFTGLKCPGCGSQRAIHELLHGNLAGAMHYNALLMAAIPVLALYLIADVIKRRYPTLDNVLNHPATIITILTVVVAWTIARNIWGF